jgi:hypothetical protein
MKILNDISCNFKRIQIQFNSIQFNLIDFNSNSIQFKNSILMNFGP